MAGCLDRAGTHASPPVLHAAALGPVRPVGCRLRWGCSGNGGDGRSRGPNRPAAGNGHHHGVSGEGHRALSSAGASAALDVRRG